MSAAEDRHRAVNDRLKAAAASQGVDVNRLRRSLVFQRFLAHLSDSGLVLKGGYCLEARLPTKARATRDIDFVGRLALADDGDDVLDGLDYALAARQINDGFSFRPVSARRLRGDEEAARAWRISMTAYLANAHFENVVVDLVGQVDEVTGATEEIVVPIPLSLPGMGDVVVRAVDVYQHAAEKFHAYSRIYAHDRPSSRVKDLVDLVLLIESGLLSEPQRLRDRLDVVYAERDAAAPPQDLPLPPGDWAAPFRATAIELHLDATTTMAAYDLVIGCYAATRTEGTLQ